MEIKQFKIKATITLNAISEEDALDRFSALMFNKLIDNGVPDIDWQSYGAWEVEELETT